MADFGARWNFSGTDRRMPSPKRARRDYGYEDRSAWGSRENDRVTGSSNALPYGSLSTDLINAVTSGLGLGGVANAFAALDDPTLSQTSQMMGYDMSGRPGMNLNPVHDGLPPDASSTLFVDGLPSDCSRREAAHIFRPFIGFKEVRLVHKDAKRASTGDKLVLCFVEFVDAKCAATALEALQGYKFDENDPDSYVLRLTFARYGPRGGNATSATGAASAGAPANNRARSPFRGGGGGGGGGRDRSPYRRNGGGDRRR